MNYEILEGDNRDTLKTLDDCSVDAIVTDPPYGIDFLGKAWDANTGALETYTECLRVLKPGGYILAFSAARTYHHLAITLERAGFEIRDQLMWLYLSGFPKSQTVRGHPGWKTGLKPAHEPIAMARKPLNGSCVNNMDQWGVGALNIDASRIPFGEDDDPSATFAGGGTNWHDAIAQEDTDARATLEDRKAFSSDLGRYPSNVLGEVEGYQKFFYCPKVSRKERHVGFDLDSIPTDNPTSDGNYMNTTTHPTKFKKEGNNHPTVKPVELMKYLIRLVTPPNSIVLDPFNGSGSTGMAAVELGHTYIGCELDPDYVEIAKKRIEAWNTVEYENNFGELFE